MAMRPLRVPTTSESFLCSAALTFSSLLAEAGFSQDIRKHFPPPQPATQAARDIVKISRAAFTIEAPADLKQEILKKAPGLLKKVGDTWFGSDSHLKDEAWEIRVAVKDSDRVFGQTTYYMTKDVLDPRNGFDVKIFASDEPAEVDAVLAHELCHVSNMMYYRRNLPRWADEGMAMLVENLDPTYEHRRILSAAKMRGDIMPASHITSLAEYPSDKTQCQLFYAQSYCLVSMLCEEKGKGYFARFMKDTIQIGFEASLSKHYGFRTIDDFEKEYRAYLAALTNDREELYVSLNPKDF